MRYPEFAAWLKRKMKARDDMTQEELARRSGVRQSIISRWLLGDTQPSTVNCHKLATVFRVDPDVVLGLVGHRSPAPEMEEPDIEDLLTQALDRWRTVRERQAPFTPHLGPASATPTRGVDLPADGSWPKRFTLLIEGDCLLPDVHSGDLAFFRADPTRQARVGEIVAAVVAGEFHVKKLIERNGLWRLSDNDGVLVATSEDVDVIGLLAEVYTARERPEERIGKEKG